MSIELLGQNIVPTTSDYIRKEYPHDRAWALSQVLSARTEERAEIIRLPTQWMGMGTRIAPPPESIPDVLWMGQGSHEGLQHLAAVTLRSFTEAFKFSKANKDLLQEALQFTNHAYEELTSMRDLQIRKDPQYLDVRRKSGEVYSTHKMRVMIRFLGFLGSYFGEVYSTGQGIDLLVDTVGQDVTTAAIIVSLWHDFKENSRKYRYSCEMVEDEGDGIGSFRVEGEYIKVPSKILKLINVGLEALHKPFGGEGEDVAQAQIQKVREIRQQLTHHTLLEASYKEYYSLAVEGIKACDRIDNFQEQIIKQNGHYLPPADSAARKIIESTARWFPALDADVRQKYLRTHGPANMIYLLFSTSQAASQCVDFFDTSAQPQAGYYDAVDHQGEMAQYPYLDWNLHNQGSLFTTIWEPVTFDLGNSNDYIHTFIPRVPWGSFYYGIYDFHNIAGEYRLHQISQRRKWRGALPIFRSLNLQYRQFTDKMANRIFGSTSWSQLVDQAIDKERKKRS